MINKLENQKKQLAHVKETHSSILCDKKSSYIKSENVEIPSKSWSGYPANSEHSQFQSSACSSMEMNLACQLKNQIPSSAMYKTVARSVFNMYPKFCQFCYIYIEHAESGLVRHVYRLFRWSSRIDASQIIHQS